MKVIHYKYSFKNSNYKVLSGPVTILLIISLATNKALSISSRGILLISFLTEFL